MRSLRVGFAGTPPFAVRALEALHRAGCTIPVVLTRADRPFGRGLALGASPVALAALDLGLRVEKPERLRDPATLAALAEIPLDVMVVAAYGMILPPQTLAWPVHGCLNLHASLLPRWRGAAPVMRAIEAADPESGITVMQMDAGLDTGAIVRQRSLPIGPRETAGGLLDRLASLGSELIVETLAVLARDGRLDSTPQPAAGVTWAAKIGPGDVPIDWAQSAEWLDRRIRALAPAPGAVTRWEGLRLKIREALPAAARTTARSPHADLGRGAGDTVGDTLGAGGVLPGSVLRVRTEGIEVACGGGATADVLLVTRVQPAGGRAMAATAFAAGHRVVPGGRFD